MFKFLLPLLTLPLFLFGAVQETLTIIKPNAVRRNHVGEIISRYEREGFTVKNLKMTQLSKLQAEQFYKEHESKPFFEELTTYMSSGPVVIIELQADDAVFKNRKLIGDTNPKNAEPNTLRALYGESKARNGLHGSDSPESAAREIQFFFK